MDLGYLIFNLLIKRWWLKWSVLFAVNWLCPEHFKTKNSLRNMDNSRVLKSCFPFYHSLYQMKDHLLFFVIVIVLCLRLGKEHENSYRASKFYYFLLGHGDVVCCFSCGTEMSGWTSTENIWRRHARQAPQCQLLIQEKGSDYVAQVIEEHGRFQTPEREPKIAVCTM